MTPDQLAAVLVAAGFDPPPYVGDVWVDEYGPSFPGAVSASSTITSIGNTVTGWQARVERREVDANGVVVYTGRGIIYLDHLVNQGSAFRYRRACASWESR